MSYQLSGLRYGEQSLSVFYHSPDLPKKEPNMFDLSVLQANDEPDDYGFFGAIANDETSWALFDDQLVWDGHGWTYDGIHQSPLQELPSLSTSPPKSLIKPATTIKAPRRSAPLPAPMPIRPSVAFNLTGDTFVLPPGSRRIGQGHVQHQTPAFIQAFQANAANISSTLAGSPESSTMPHFHKPSYANWVPPPGSRRLSGPNAQPTSLLRPKPKTARQPRKKQSKNPLETVSLQQVERVKTD